MERRSFFAVLAGMAALVGLPLAAQATEPAPLTLWGDGVHDDTAALQAWFERQPVQWPDGRPVGHAITGGTFKTSGVIRFAAWPQADGQALQAISDAGRDVAHGALAHSRKLGELCLRDLAQAHCLLETRGDRVHEPVYARV